MLRLKNDMNCLPDDSEPFDWLELSFCRMQPEVAFGLLALSTEPHCKSAQI